MPKTPSDRLFQLIKSLSSPEKRYFKLFVNTDGSRDNKYIRLFDAIDAQEEFDDDALRQFIYADEPIQSRKYSELKAYLYEMILKSLQSYDEKNAIDYRLRNLLLGVRSLYKRSLFEDCRKVLQKAEKWADFYEKFDVILEVLNWQKQIAYARAEIGFLDKKLTGIASREADYLNKIQNVTDFQNLFFRVLVAVRKNTLRVDSQDTELSTITANHLLTSPECALTHQSRILYFRIRSVLSYAGRSYSDFYELSKALITLMESKPHFLAEDVSEYISALSNMAVSCGYLGRFDEVAACLDKMQQITPLTLDDRLKIHRQYYTHKFRLCIETGDFNEGLAVVQAHLKELTHLDKEVFERSSFYFQYFYIFFGAGNYDKALEYLNQWLNLPRSIERQDLQSLARILNLIIHYEMGNTLLLDSLLRSTYRFLHRTEGLLHFELRLMQFIRQANRANSRRAIEGELQALKTDFHTLTQDPAEKAMLQLFDFEAWLDSKIQRRSFAEVVREKFQRQLKAE